MTLTVHRRASETTADAIRRSLDGFTHISFVSYDPVTNYATYIIHGYEVSAPLGEDVKTGEEFNIRFPL